jgi:hypothetical protein
LIRYGGLSVWFWFLQLFCPHRSLDIVDADLGRALPRVLVPLVPSLPPHDLLFTHNALLYAFGVTNIPRHLPSATLRMGGAASGREFMGTSTVLRVEDVSSSLRRLLRILLVLSFGVNWGGSCFLCLPCPRVICKLELLLLCIGSDDYDLSVSSVKWSLMRRPFSRKRNAHKSFYLMMALIT